MKPELWYLFSAYLLIWAALFAYFVHLGRQQTRLAAELDLLRRLIDRGKGGAPS